MRRWRACPRSSSSSPLSPYKDWQQLAWTGALFITFAVLALSVTARVLARQRVANESGHGRSCRAKYARNGSGGKDFGGGSQLFLRRDAGAEIDFLPALPQRSDGLQRSFRLRKVDAAARSQSHV